MSRLVSSELIVVPPPLLLPVPFLFFGAGTFGGTAAGTRFFAPGWQPIASLLNADLGLGAAIVCTRLRVTVGVPDTTNGRGVTWSVLKNGGPTGLTVDVETATPFAEAVFDVPFAIGDTIGFARATGVLAVTEPLNISAWVEYRAAA